MLRDGSPCRYHALPIATLCGNHQRARRTALKKRIEKRLAQAKTAGSVLSAASTLYHAIHFVFDNWSTIEQALNQVVIRLHENKWFRSGEPGFSTVEDLLMRLDSAFEGYDENQFVRMDRFSAVATHLVARAELLSLASSGGRQLWVSYVAGSLGDTEEFHRILKSDELRQTLQSTKFQLALDDLFTASQWFEDDRRTAHMERRRALARP